MTNNMSKPNDDKTELFVFAQQLQVDAFKVCLQIADDYQQQGNMSSAQYMIPVGKGLEKPKYTITLYPLKM